MIPGKEKGQSLTVGAGDLAWSISATTKHPKEANAFVGIHDPSRSHAKVL